MAEPVPWPGPARVLLDVVPHAGTTSLDVLSDLTDVVAEKSIDVLQLGPPLRLQLPATQLIRVMDAVSYDQITLLYWPFSHPPSPDAAG